VTGWPFRINADAQECLRPWRFPCRSSAVFNAGRSPSCAIVLRCFGVPSSGGVQAATRPWSPDLLPGQAPLHKHLPCITLYSKPFAVAFALHRFIVACCAFAGAAGALPPDKHELTKVLRAYPRNPFWVASALHVFHACIFCCWVFPAAAEPVVSSPPAATTTSVIPSFVTRLLRCMVSHHHAPTTGSSLHQRPKRAEVASLLDTLSKRFANGGRCVSRSAFHG
jgi:hypothetical protein